MKDIALVLDLPAGRFPFREKCQVDTHIRNPAHEVCYEFMYEFTRRLQKVSDVPHSNRDI